VLYLAGRLFEEGSSSRKTLSFEITVYHLQSRKWVWFIYRFFRKNNSS